jgi:hypothetical protein
MRRPLAAAIATLIVFCATQCASASPYPRLVSYAGMSSGGGPLIKADATVDSVVCQKLARYPMVTVNLNAALYDPRVVSTLRFFNPNIKLIGYHQWDNWHLDTTFVPQSSDKSFYADWHRAIMWAHAGQGPSLNPGTKLDWSQKDWADTATAILCNVVKRTGLDGLFFDFMTPMLTSVGPMDEGAQYLRLHNARKMVSAIRAAAKPGFLIFGNGLGSYGADRCLLDGDMNESFPFGLTTFATARLQHPGDWLKSEHTAGTMGDAKEARYTLGVACLFDTYASHGTDHYVATPYEGRWWFPEYSVNTTTAAADSTGSNPFWLGENTTGPTRQTSINVNLWRRDFENGIVLVNGGGSSVPNIALGGNYRVAGTSTTITSVALLAANDAVFLVRMP